jgi:hypothetical protein
MYSTLFLNLFLVSIFTYFAIFLKYGVDKEMYFFKLSQTFMNAVDYMYMRYTSYCTV